MSVLGNLYNVASARGNGCTGNYNESNSYCCSHVMYRIMYELAVCSDGMTEAQPRSFRQNKPASEYII